MRTSLILIGGAVVAAVCILTIGWYLSVDRGSWQSVDPRGATALPPVVREIEWQGGIDYVAEGTWRPQFWVTGKCSMDAIRSFCAAGGLTFAETFERPVVLDEAVRRNVVGERYALTGPARIWGGAGHYPSLGYVLLYYSPSGQRVVIRVTTD